MNQIKKIETPYKDIHGKTICVGDVIVFGLLGQHWKISQVEKSNKSKKDWPPASSFIMTVVSEDSGIGYWEILSSDIEILENRTEICTDHYS